MQKQVHPVHFEDFSGHQFERLCFAFMRQRYPRADVIWSGQVGGDAGQDIVCNLPDGTQIVVQCANVQFLKFEKIRDDIQKAANASSGRQGQFLVITGRPISVTLRDRIHDEAQQRGFLSGAIWSGVEFEEQLRLHTPELLRRFLEGIEFPELSDQLDASIMNSAQGAALLEYETSLILTSRSFSVSANYSYSRIVDTVDKEYAVTLRGIARAGGTGESGSQSLFDVLIECEYRAPNVSWLFLPEPRSPQGDLDDGLQCVDYFSSSFVHPIVSTTVYHVDNCYATVEFGVQGSRDTHAQNSGASEMRSQRAAQRLQYALPPIVALRAKIASVSRPEDALPFFFAAIVVTNARLFVAMAERDAVAVIDPRKIEEIGKQVPFVLWSQGVGPDFKLHAQRQFATLSRIAACESMQFIEDHRRSAGEARWVLPSALARRIEADASKISDIADFGRIFVVNIDSLSALLAHLAERFGHMATTLKNRPFVTW